LQAGLPEGVLNVVNGYGDAGMHIASHMDIDKVLDIKIFFLGFLGLFTKLTSFMLCL